MLVSINRPPSGAHPLSEAFLYNEGREFNMEFRNGEVFLEKGEHETLGIAPHIASVPAGLIETIWQAALAGVGEGIYTLEESGACDVMVDAYSGASVPNDAMNRLQALEQREKALRRMTQNVLGIDAGTL